MDILVPTKLNAVRDLAAYYTTIESINTSITNIVTSRKTTRPFNQYYGVDIQSYFNKPVTDSLLARISNEVMDQLETYEQRIVINNVTTVFNSTSKSFVVDVHYSYAQQTETITVVVTR